MTGGDTQTPRPPDRVVYLEFWHPARYFGRSGPQVFFRERAPRLLGGGGGVEFDHGPWQVTTKEFWRRISTLPNRYYTLEQHPGVTFCWRKFKDPEWSDWQEANALRRAAEGS